MTPRLRASVRVCAALAALAPLAVACSSSKPAVQDDAPPEGGAVVPEAGVDAAPDGGSPDAGRACGTPLGNRQWGTPADDEVLDLAADDRGGVFVAGYVGGTLGVADDGPVGDARGFVRGLLGDGQHGFETFVDTTATDLVDALTVGPDRRLHFAARTRGAHPGSQNQGTFDLVVGTLSPGGALAGLRQLGVAPPERARAVRLDASGRLVVAGFEDTYIPTNYVEAWANPFVAAFPLGANGPAEPAFRWRGTSTEPDVVRGVAVSAAGDIFAVGHVESGAGSGAVVTHLGTDGKVIRALLWSAGPNDSLAAAAFAPDGDLVVAGSTMKKLGAQSYGGHDAFVAKLDPVRLETKWVAQIGTARAEWIDAMAITKSGRVVVVGEQSDTTGSAPLGGPSDAFAAAFTADGQVVWTKDLGSAGEDALTSVVIDACGEAVAGGWTTGSPVTPNAGGRDAWVVVLGNPDQP